MWHLSILCFCWASSFKKFMERLDVQDISSASLANFFTINWWNKTSYCGNYCNKWRIYRVNGIVIWIGREKHESFGALKLWLSLDYTCSSMHNDSVALDPAFRRRFCVFKNKSSLKCIHCQHWLSAPKSTQHTRALYLFGSTQCCFEKILHSRGKFCGFQKKKIFWNVFIANTDYLHKTHQHKWIQGPDKKIN